MNKILFFALFFALTNCYIKISECTTGTVEKKYEDYNIIDGDIYIDTSKDYEYNWEFDWTDDDSKTFKVRFIFDLDTGSAPVSNNNFIPLFINASLVDSNWDSKLSPSYGSANIRSTDYDDLSDIKIKSSIGNEYQVYYPFDFELKDNLLTANIKSTTIKANEKDVNQKFIKYFAFAYCDGDKRVQIQRTNILATFNNGNYFSISKILLATLALLFL